MGQAQQSSGMFVVKPQHAIVASYVSEFRKQLQAVIEEGHLQLVIDLEGVDMIDSAGLAVFMLCQNTLAGRGGQLKVVTDNKDFQHLFRVMRMDQHFTVAQTI